MEIVRSDIVLTAQEFGNGIRQFISMKVGLLFFPYRIIRSSYQPPEEFRIALDTQTKVLQIAEIPIKEDIGLVVRFKLSKAEVIDAIALAICLKHMIFFKDNRVTTAPEGIPESMKIELEFIPKAAAAGKYPHEFTQF